MGTLTQLGLLLRKSWLQQKRHPIASACDILLPVGLLLLLVLLHSVAPVEVFNTKTYAQASRPVISVAALPRALLHNNLRLAVAPASPAARELVSRLDAAYPGINMSHALGSASSAELSWMSVPKFSDVIQWFPDEAALTQYVRARNYGAHGKIFAAIIVRSGAPRWDYTLRFNSSNVPPTTRVQEDVARGLIEENIVDYLSTKVGRDEAHVALPGFVPLQMAIDKVIINATATAGPSTDGKNLMAVAWNHLRFSDAPDDTTTASDAADHATAAASSAGFRIDVPSTTPNAAEQHYRSHVADFLRSAALAPQMPEVTSFPVSRFNRSDFYSLLADFFSLYFVLTFLVPVFHMIRGLVGEKESKIREGLSMMGMGDVVQPLSWLVTYAVIFFLAAFLATLITFPNIFGSSNVILVFGMFLLFGWSSAAFCVLISTFFSRSRTAAIMGSVIFLAGFFPFYATSSPDAAYSSKFASCFASPTAFALALNFVAQWERDGIGLHFDNVKVPVAGFDFHTPAVMMAVDTILYLLLAWYLDKVMPRDYGVRHKPWFLFTFSFWFPNRRVRAGDAAARRGSDGMPSLLAGPSGALELSLLQEQGGVVEVGNADANMEPPNPSLQALASNGRCVQIRGLRKEFPTPDGTKVAVKALDMTMYEGQIFALLGHNGAGKTTTLSILSGMLPATAGDASVFGLSVASQMASIRRIMGVCPQHDVLFPDLTVLEHLELFAGLKEVPLDVRAQKISEIIAEVGLTEKVYSQSSTLSGGMKRKLSLAIALLGDSRIVFLDEPTSGMDPYSRRSTWSVIQNNRQGRIIVLTTHFMDEADLLGDRIGIMADGELRCCGSPMFLKARFGVGYNLTLVRTPQADTRQLTTLVRSHVPTAKMLSSVGAEVAFQLPLGATTAFPRLFDAVDALKGQGVQSYGLSVTTMEEVFLKVAQHGKLEDQEEEQRLVRQLSDRSLSARGLRSSAAATATGAALAAAVAPPKEPDMELGMATPVPSADADLNVSSLPRDGQFWPHLKTLLVKRLQYAKRDQKMIVFQLLIPVLALVAGLQLLTSATPSNQPAVLLTATGYNPNVAANVRHSTAFPFAIFPQAQFPETQDAEWLMGHAPADMGIRFGPREQPLATMTNASCVYESATEQCEAGKKQCILPAVTTAPAFPWQQSVVDRRTCTLPDADLRLLRTLSLSEFLLRTAGNYQDTRYGAGYMAVATRASTRFEPVLVVNTSGTHSLPLFTNYMTNTLLRALAHEGGTPAEELPSIRIASHPLPFTKQEESELQSVGAFVAAIFVVMAFAFIPASVAIFVVRERETNVKHQQLLSGVSIPAYWVSSFLWDFACYLVAFSASMIVMLIYDVKSFTEGEAFGVVALCFLLYGAATISFTYLVSFLFQRHTTAQNLLLLGNLFMMIMMIASFVMMQLKSTCKVNGVLHWLYLLFPGFSLGDALIRLSLIQLLPQLDATCYGRPPALDVKYSPFDFEVAGKHMLMLAVTSVGYFILAVLYDFARNTPSLRSIFTRRPHVAIPPHADDEDVAAEAQRVASGAANSDTILLQNLRKVYPGSPPKIAVRGMSFGIPRGECFGFLGINGAGKTTTMKMLTGDILATGGNARLAGFNIMTQQMAVRRLLGYCPQFDALLDLLTVREHLEMFARIKGFRGDQVPRLVEAKLDQLGLRKFENKLAHTLSGGNKRKLSVAIALIGNPPLVFLDEPSTGVDPAARREMWKVLSDVSTARQECSIVLTTHSMEECEALCSRVGIMVGGRLRCLGSVQHLKNRFGRGYMFELKLNAPEETQVAHLEHTLAQLAPDERITLATLAAACNALGDPYRANEFAPSGSAWLLHSALMRDGYLPVRTLAIWWQGETDARSLSTFMTRHFPGCNLVERHSDMFRYNVPQLPERIGAVFARFEAHKEDLHIREYSVSQTTLEQIFNSFASQQEEEKGHVHGMSAPEAAADGALLAAGPGSH